MLATTLVMRATTYGGRGMYPNESRHSCPTVKFHLTSCFRAAALCGASYFSHAPRVRDGAFHHVSKAFSREDRQIDQPVSRRDSPAFHLHATLARMLDAMLIGPDYTDG